MKRLIILAIGAALWVALGACGSSTVKVGNHEVPKSAAGLVAPSTGDGLRDELNYYADEPYTDAEYAKLKENIEAICNGTNADADAVMRETFENMRDDYGSYAAIYEIGVKYECKAKLPALEKIDTKWFNKLAG